jgi:hypothetical protein
MLAFLLTRLPIILRTDDILLNIVLEDGAAGSADAKRVVAQLRKQPETQPIVKMLREDVAFEPKDKWPGLQASDLLAWSALKAAPQNPEMIDLPDDAALAHAQTSAEWKPPTYHCRLDEQQLGMLKGDILTMVELRKQIAAETFSRAPSRSG